MKENKKIRFGNTAQKVLMYALPVLITLALSLTLYVARLDGNAFLKERQTIVLALETISRFSVCVAVGTVLADYAEKKTSA